MRSGERREPGTRSPGPICSVIVPAWNEEGVIGSTLAAMLAGARPGELDVVVVANGCDDATAEVARAFGPDARVVETPLASKAAALDLGDRVARCHPRLFVDADVVVDIEAVRAVAAVLDTDAPRAAAPRLRVDLAGRPWSVRAYYRIWQRTAYPAAGALGSGFYGVSATGRARFGAFPDLIADDLFVPGRFTADERVVVDGHHFVQPAPRDRASVVARRSRAAAGTLQYRQRFPDGHLRQIAGARRAWARIGARPWLWPSAAVYLSVRTQAQWRARGKLRRGELHRWDRDETSRALATVDQ